MGRREGMVEALDFYFPLIVCFYGLIVIFVLEIPNFSDLKELRNSWAFQTLEHKKPWAWTCFVVGMLWSVQNIFV